jgi:hypothetical protein
MRRFNNREIAGSKVARAINDGSEVDPGVVDTAIQKWALAVHRY